jgi:hypothetical protein
MQVWLQTFLLYYALLVPGRYIPSTPQSLFASSPRYYVNGTCHSINIQDRISRQTVSNLCALRLGTLVIRNGDKWGSSALLEARCYRSRPISRATVEGPNFDGRNAFPRDNSLHRVLALRTRIRIRSIGSASRRQSLLSAGNYRGAFDEISIDLLGRIHSGSFSSVGATKRWASCSAMGKKPTSIAQSHWFVASYILRVLHWSFLKASKNMFSSAAIKTISPRASPSYLLNESPY